METGRSLRSGKRETGAEMSPDRLFLFHMGDEEKRTRIPRIIDSKILSKGDYDQVPEGQNWDIQYGQGYDEWTRVMRKKKTPFDVSKFTNGHRNFWDSDLNFFLFPDLITNPPPFSWIRFEYSLSCLFIKNSWIRMFQILNQNLILGQDSLKFHTEPQRGIIQSLHSGTSWGPNRQKVAMKK